MTAKQTTDPCRTPWFNARTHPPVNGGPQALYEWRCPMSPTPGVRLRPAHELEGCHKCEWRGLTRPADAASVAQYLKRADPVQEILDELRGGAALASPRAARELLASRLRWPAVIDWAAGAVRRESYTLLRQHLAAPGPDRERMFAEHSRYCRSLGLAARKLAARARDRLMRFPSRSRPDRGALVAFVDHLRTGPTNAEILRAAQRALPDTWKPSFCDGQTFSTDGFVCTAISRAAPEVGAGHVEAWLLHRWIRELLNAHAPSGVTFVTYTEWLRHHHPHLMGPWVKPRDIQAARRAWFDWMIRYWENLRV